MAEKMSPSMILIINDTPDFVDGFLRPHVNTAPRQQLSRVP